MKYLFLTVVFFSLIKAIMKRFKFIPKTARFLLIPLITASFFVSAAQAQDDVAGGMDPRLRDGLDYINGLNAMRLPAYAQVIMKRIEPLPGARTYIKIAEIQSLIAQGKFPEVKAIIVKEPSQNSEATWGMKLAMADGLYAWGKYGEAQGVYNMFFKAFPEGPTPELKQFYMNSAYKYSQMLLLMDKKAAAVKAYKNVLKAKPPSYIQRQVKGEMAELMMQVLQTMPKSNAAEVAKYDAVSAELEKLVEDLLWVQDIWFGKGIVLLAQIREMKGDIKGCQALLEDKEYKKRLLAIDKALKQSRDEGHEDLTKLSPMANCRFLIGSIMLKEAERLLRAGGPTPKVEALLAGKVKAGQKLKEGQKPKRTAGALQHFVNVYAKYPSTAWAPDAVKKAERVIEILEDKFDAEINIHIDEALWTQIKDAQFQEARNLFRQNQYDKAIEAYIRVLNRFPEDEISVAGLSELTRSYIEVNNELYARMLVGYLAERFGENVERCETAGNKLIGVAIMYEERKQIEERDAVYDQFFANFKKHSRAPSMLFKFGEERFSEKKFEAALKYYSQIVEKYPKSPLADKSRNKMAFAYSLLENKEQEIAILNDLVNELGQRPVPGTVFISAKFRLAVSSMMLSKDIRTGAKKKKDGAEGGEEPEAPVIDEAKVKALAHEYKKSMAAAKIAKGKYGKALALYKKAKADKDVTKTEKYRKMALAYKGRFTSHAKLAEKHKADYAAAKNPSAGAMDPEAESTMYAEKALKQFGDVVALMTAPDARVKYSKTDADVESNQGILEGAMFYEAMSYVMKSKPEAKVAEYRKTAIGKLNAMIERFPKSKFAPAALSQIGTLYTVLEDASGAEKALRRLQADYPDSPEAKMSDFTLAMNLLKLGRKQQAEKIFKRMLSSGGKYKPSQIQMAGEELMNVEEYEIAQDAFAKVITSAKKPALIQAAMAYSGKVLIELEKYQESMDILDKLLADYPLNAYTVEAAKNLSRAAGEVAMREEDSDKRFDIFNKAVKAIKQARKFKANDKGFKCESDVLIARILELKMEAEERHAEPGSEVRAKKYLDEAVATYQMIIMLSDRKDPTVKPHIGDAYARCWPLLAKLDRWEDVKTDADVYLAAFIDGKHIAEARKWKNRARGKLASRATVPTETVAPETVKTTVAPTNESSSVETKKEVE